MGEHEDEYPVIEDPSAPCRCFQFPHERGDRAAPCRYSLTDAEEAIFAVVRRRTADTREKRDWPWIADRQAVRIVLALSDAAPAPGALDAAKAEALREAADEVHIEARWQTEQKRRLAATSDVRATVQYTHSIDRLLLLETLLRDRADSLAVKPDDHPPARTQR